MRLLMYSQDGAGLGHLRRAGNIAQELLARAPGSDVLILSDSPTTPLLPVTRGLDYVKLPTILKCGRVSSRASSWRTSTLALPVQQVLRLRSTLMGEVLSAFQPDAFLVGHMPLGALGELVPLLAAASRAKPRPRLYLGLRDVLDAPDVIRRAWRESGSYEALRVFDAVLIYGCEHVYDADAAYDLRSHTENLLYCNYVGPPPKAIPPARVEETEPRERLILAMCGGGADAYRLAETFMAAVPALARRDRIRAVLLTGPHMHPTERGSLRNQLRSHPVEILALSDEVSRLVRKASLVLTMAGYNSVCEVVEAGKKALVVPRRGPSAEQRIRAGLFAERGLIHALDPDLLEPDTLALSLAEALHSAALPDPSCVPPMNGAQRAADVLLQGERGADP